jgi:hypothetical protein
VIELTENGIDYVSHGDFEEAAFTGGWPTLQAILDGSTKKLTQQEIIYAWPAVHPCPATATVWRWLDRAVAAKQIFREGKGTRNAPYRYWSASLEKKWQKEPWLRDMNTDLDSIRKQIGME